LIHEESFALDIGSFPAMCGIAGIVAPGGFDPSELASMTHLVKYRGPDGYGCAYFDLSSHGFAQCFHNEDGRPNLKRPRMGLGSRRLAILDLSESGNQPMQIENGRLWIAYNGEVYNYIEIRAVLEKLGHAFRTQTDTEVILRAYAEWGPDCVVRFNGMWSFAIYDRERQRLFCSRDRFGVKPFYYFSAPGLLVFGSEIKQILEYPGIPRRANDRVAFDYLELGLQDHTDETFFCGIRQLPGGHSLHIDLANPLLAVCVERYWELPLEDDLALSEDDCVERFRELFSRAVNWRMRSDVPVGSCLSGGLDSSSIVALAVSAKSEPEFHTFSSCFEQETFDERPFIREVVAATKANFHAVFPQAQGMWNDLNCLIWHHDEPLGGTSVYAQWCVMRAARRAGVPVLLDGQGGDEILCGYRKFYFFYLWHRLKRGDLRRFAAAAAWSRNRSQRRWDWNHAKRYASSLLGARSESAVARLCDSDFVERSREYPGADIGPGKSVRERQRDDLIRYSVPALLHCEDRNSMAHSVESRVPMLDYELATFAVNCPIDLKLRGGWTKWILREALKGTLPESIRTRRTKLGFETPQEQWLTDDSCGVIRAMAQDSDFRISRILSAKKVQRELRVFLEGKAGRLTSNEIFRVMNLELWARAFSVS